MTQTATAPAAPTTASNAVMNHRQILLVIYGLMAGMFLGALDQTIVGTAIRTIGDDLHGLDQQAWVTTGYLIASTITTPIYGKLSDLFGRRPLFITAIGIFIIGSLAASFSTSMLMLAGFRALQGLGAGGLMSLPLAIMGDMLAPRERAKYQGYFLAVFGISSVIGPLVGGVFAGADDLLFVDGWRWVFLINVPIGVIALFMVLTFLHLPNFGERRKPRIDWWGASLVIVTLVPLLLIAEQGRDWGWDSPRRLRLLRHRRTRAHRVRHRRACDGRRRDPAAEALRLARVLDGSRPVRAHRLRHVRRDADHPAVPADRQGGSPRPSPASRCCPWSSA
ncbi:MFS transporter [Curtobacterium sp. MCJR17_043]|uniref:MFS transporter n=1 Tax=Curtobacterium sp. MCJR17_043 TaxID=2175660 RepID=UPI0032E8CAC6